MDLTWNNVTDVFKTDGKLSVWKLMGGAAAASVLPTVAPIAALAATGAAAVVAAKNMKDSVIEAIETRGEKRGEATATARYSAKFTKLKEAFDVQVERYKAQDRYFDLMLAMHAVGMACAACDGVVSDEERQDIEEFIGGTALKKAPPRFREKIDELSRNPPSLATAFAMASRCDADTMNLFDDIIDLVIQADGVVETAEEQFRFQWRGLRAAA